MQASKHWKLHRITALIMIPLLIWLVVSLLTAMQANGAIGVEFIQNKINAIILSLFIIVTCKHASMGYEEIFTDYVNEKCRSCVIKLTKFLFFLLAIAGVGAIVAINFQG